MRINNNEDSNNNVYIYNLRLMKTITKWFCFFNLILILLWACSNPKDKVDETYINGLKEKRLGNTTYYISLPENFTIEMSKGPDFDVYYFYAADTTIKESFSGGIYMGFNPSEFKPNRDSCKTEVVKGAILNKIKEWKMAECNGKYSIQTIVESSYKEGWTENIHAFGNGFSKKDMNKLLVIFSTLKKK